MLRNPGVELFTKTLGIAEPWFVRKVEFSHENRRLDVYVDFRRGAKLACPICGAESGVYDTTERVWRHLDCFQYATYLHARQPRIWCHSCTRAGHGGVKTVALPWARPEAHFTLYFEAYVLALAQEMPVLAVARLVGESDDRIWTIIHHYVDEARSKADFSDTTKLAVDETAATRGHNYVTVVADSEHKKVLFATPGRGAETITEFRKDFVAHNGNPDRIETVSCDMSPAYIHGVQQEFPNAKLTFDKFHVSKLLGDAVDEVRRAEQKKRPELKRTRYLWLMNPNRLKDEQKSWLSTLSRQNLKTAKAYQLRLNFAQLWEQSKEFAKAFLDKWYFWATHSRLEPVIRAAKTIRKTPSRYPFLVRYTCEQRHPREHEQPHPGCQTPRQRVQDNAKSHRRYLSAFGKAGFRFTHVILEGGRNLTEGIAVRMSMESRREYLSAMRVRYLKAASRQEKSRILDELEATVGYARKYAIAVMKSKPDHDRPRTNRKRSLRYLDAMPVVQVVWEALDYPCAERLHPVLLATAEQLARHGEIQLTPELRRQLQAISRATLARRIAKWSKPGAKHVPSGKRPSSGPRLEIPVQRYDWDEDRPGALEIDLVEHNGGSSLGHYAYTLSVVDVVTGYSRRLATLGRGQAGVEAALRRILAEWPYDVWGIHSDNGSEFINNHLTRFAKARGLSFTRSRPYHKNDNAHVEQKNRFLVREIVGYERYDTPEHVSWLNTVYAWLDVYANACLPMRKVVHKTREGARIHKRYDIARTPLQRALESGIVPEDRQQSWADWASSLNPLQLRRQLVTLLAQGPEGANVTPVPVPTPVWTTDQTQGTARHTDRRSLRACGFDGQLYELPTTPQARQRGKLLRSSPSGLRPFTPSHPIHVHEWGDRVRFLNELAICLR
nr:ISL3 family transposase [Alicyclobacillus macrosporangiidus]